MSTVNRRRFVKLSAGMASGLKLSIPLNVATKRISVTDYDADPTGRRDASPAVRQAIAALPRSGGTLIFPHGTYSFSTPHGTIMTFEGLRELQIEGNDSLLQFAGLARPFLFKRCSDLRLNGVRIDFPHPPFSQGIVRATSPDHFDIQIDTPFVVNGTEHIQAIGEYDRDRRLPAANGIDLYGGVSPVQLFAPQMLRLFVMKDIGVKQGMTLVLRHQVYGSDAITLQECDNCRLTQVVVHTAPGMGLLGLGSTDITLQNFKVTTTPGTNRLLSTTADGAHFTDCRGSLNIAESSFFGMGDDAVNVFASYWSVVRSISPQGFEVSARGGKPIGPWQLPRPQDQLHCVDRNTFAPLFETAVKAATVSGPNALLTVETPPNALIPNGSLVVNLNAAPRLTVRNNNFLGNRARGVVAHSDAVIQENSFSGCSLAALLFAPDARWMEGPAVHDVKIAMNKFTDCGYGRPQDRRGVVCIDTAHDPHPRVRGQSQVNENIEIVDNIFERTPAPQIFCSSSKGISILRNIINQAPPLRAEASSDDVIVLVGVTDAVVTDNIAQNGHVALEGCSQPFTVAGNPGIASRYQQ